MFSTHSIKYENNEQCLYMYINPNDSEFANDFLSANDNSEKEHKLKGSVLKYIQQKGIDFKGKTVKIMLGATLVASVIVGTNFDANQSAIAKRNDSSLQTISTTNPTENHLDSFEYTVMDGDTLYSISTEFNTTVEKIKEINSLLVEYIYDGQVLLIPSTNHMDKKIYTVKDGDTLYSISKKFNVTTDYLTLINNLSTDNLFPGQTLKIEDLNIKTTLYTVLKNDTLYSISTKYNISINDIKSWNNLATDTLNIGQILTIYHADSYNDTLFGYDLSSNAIVNLLRIETGVTHQISLEKYIFGVVASEMPASFEFEALKAQALASRTYIVSRLASNPSIIINDTTEYQAYSDTEELKSIWLDDYNYYAEKIARAVYETKNQVISYNGSYIDAVFYSTSNGKTLSSEQYWTSALPYLKSVDSHWDVISPFYEKTKILQLNEFNSKMGIDISSRNDISINRFSDSGAVESVIIDTSVFTGNDVRRKLHLNSTSFDLAIKDGEVIITMNGWGHGVGMSQYGAHGMAMEGYTANDIIKHYYTGVDIEEI